MKKRNLKPPMLAMLMLLTLLCTWLPVGAYDFMVGDLCYNINENGTSVTVYRNSGKSLSGELIIPETVTNGDATYTVTSIGYSAFYSCSGLTSVTIPNTVTEIGWEAFYGCSGLTSVAIPNSVALISAQAFEECSGLTSVTIPNSVTKIVTSTFAGCRGLTSVSIPNSVTEIGFSAFSGCSGLTSVTIPNSVTYIGDGAFAGCSSLTLVTIGNSVTSIEGGAFDGCSGLTSVTIPNSVTYIGDGAFAGCSGLTSVTIPNSVTEIVGNAFSGCTGLMKVVWNVKSCNDFSTNSYYKPPFNGLSNIKSFEFGREVEKIPAYLCFNLTGLTSVTIPNSVTSIGDYAFFKCSGLTSVTIGNSVTSIGDYAFCDCSGLTSVTIPNSVTSVGEYAFLGCRSLTSVTIPNSVTSIGWSAFCGCSGLISVTIGNSVTSIYGSAFQGCTGLTSVTIPNSVTHIGGYAFCDCSGLTDIYCYAETPPAQSNSTIFDYRSDQTLYVPAASVNAYKQADGWKNFVNIVEMSVPESHTIEFADAVVKQLCVANWDTDGDGQLSYDEAAAVTSLGTVFRENSSIKSFDELQYFTGITAIGKYAFWCCSGLTSLTIPNSVTSIRYGAFQYCSGLTSVTIPNSVTAIGEETFYGCRSLTSVTIPNSVTSIGDFAFSGCSGLTSVSIPNSVTSIGKGAFIGCSGLTSVVVEAGNATYDSRDNCNAIIKTASNTLIAGCKNTTIPNSVTSIGEYAFRGCTGLTSVTIPNSVTSIGECAFYGCSGLTSVTIPNSVTSIDYLVFSYCSGLTSVVVEAGNATYDSRDNCNAIIETASNTLIAGCKNTTIPNSVTSIGDSAFFGCSGLTSVTIPNSVTNIGWSAFAYCSGLTSVTIGNSVTSIGGSAFYDCGGLTDIYCYAETPPIWSSGVDTFDFRSDQTLYVPAASVDAYKQAEVWMYFINILPIEQTPEDNEITVYCKADVAPYLYIWEMGTNSQLNGNWPGAKMTQKVVKNGETYWAQTFESAGINLIFNNGSGSQTGDFTNITTDSYFIYNGTSFAYGAIPPEAFSSSNNYVFYVNTDRWSSVSVDLYTSSSSYSRQRMTLLGHDLAGFEVYVWEAESLTATPTQLRFTNGSKYTPTAAFANGGYYVYTFYQNYAVVQLDCVAVMDPDDESQRPQLRDFSLDSSGNSAEVWNDMTQSKSFTVSGTYFNKYNRNAQLLYSVDGGEWTSLQTLTSDNAFNASFSVQFISSQVSHTLRIAAQDISGTFSTIFEYVYYEVASLTLCVGEQTYTGSAITLSDATLVTTGTEVFNQGEHFTLSNYANNVDAGTATVTVSGLPGGVIGTATKQFTISPATLSGTITLADAADAEVTYTGSAITPAVTLTHTQHGILEVDTDYTLSYRNNTKPGQATVTATGKGNYTGSLSTTFTILKAPLPDGVATILVPNDILYDGEPHAATITSSSGEFELLTDIGEIKEGIGYLLVADGYNYVMGFNNGMHYAIAVPIVPADNGRITMTDEMALINFTISDEGYALQTAEGYMMPRNIKNGVSYSTTPVYNTVSIADQATSEILIQFDDRTLSFNQSVPRWCFYRVKQGRSFLFKPVASTTDDISSLGFGSASITYINTGTGTSSTDAPVEPGNYTVNVAFAEGECYLGGTIENAAAFTIYALDATDWASVKALYNATGGASWSKTVDVSDVKYARQLVDRGLATIVKGRVTALNLSGNNLSGELPATGVSLSALTSLNISGNNLTGNLGAFVAPMTSLQSLNAANNRIATLYPPLPASVSNASLYPQNVDVTLDVDLPNLDIEALMASFPTIFLYDPSSRAYSRLPGVTATGGNDWWASFTFDGTRLAISGVSSQNLYYGASGDVLPVTVTNGGSGTQTLGTMSARLSFAQGDADFNGAINVVDLQAIINQIFAMFDGSKPFNWTAANVIVDEKLNVQDVVGEVNLLLANNSGAGMRRRAPQAGDDGHGTPAGAANLYWRDGVLYLASDKPIAALDVILAGDVKWDIARYGLTVGTRGSHTVAYSLTGGSIPAGVTPVATALEAVAPAVTAAMLSDTAALEIPVSLTDPDITGVNDIAASPAVRLVVDGSAIIVEATTPLAETGWAIAAIDGKLIAAGNGHLSAGRTQLAADLPTGAYVVSLTAADGTAVRTKVVIR